MFIMNSQIFAYIHQKDNELFNFNNSWNQKEENEKLKLIWVAK